MILSPMGEEDPSLACAKPFLDCRPFCSQLAFTSSLLDFFGPRNFAIFYFICLKPIHLVVRSVLPFKEVLLLNPKSKLHLA